MRIDDENGWSGEVRVKLLPRAARRSAVATAQQTARRLGIHAWRAAGVAALTAVSCLVTPGLALAAPTTATFSTPGQYTFTVPAACRAFR